MRPVTIFLPVVAAAALATVCSAGCGSPPEHSAETEEVALVHTQHASFDVEGMTCASCEVSIKLALKRIEGVTEVTADADAGRASATFDPDRTDPLALAAAITRLGYEATVRGTEGRE